VAKAVAILQEMYDWHGLTSRAGYNTAPRHFRISPRNFTGKRLYDWLGHNDLLVTDACKELVSGPNQRGKPDKNWVKDNLAELWPFELLLVCGKVAQRTYCLSSAPKPCRVIECPHPAARHWDRKSLDFMRRLVQEGKQSLEVRIVRGQLRAFPLIPF
jgi:hypothetical protein